MVEVIIEEVLVGPSQCAEDGEAAVDHRVVMLREKERERRLPIWIGPFEADALAVHLTETAVARPLSHDLMVRLLEAGDMRVRRVVVNKVENETFYATIVVSTPNGEREVDARPSDALNLAVRAGVPIFAAEELLVMTTVSLTKDEEGRSQFHIEWQGRDGEPKKSANWSSLLDKERLERALSTRVPSHHQQAQQPEE